MGVRDGLFPGVVFAFCWPLCCPGVVRALGVVPPGVPPAGAGAPFCTLCCCSLRCLSLDPSVTLLSVMPEKVPVVSMLKGMLMSSFPL